MKNKKRGRFQGDQWFTRNVENLMRKTLREMQAQGKMRGATIESLRGTPWYKEEYKRHAQLFKNERKIQAEERASHARSSSLKEQVEREVLAERDHEWAAEHEADTDAELLDYLRQCAAELGHTPVRREVLGSTYIADRFGNWSVALTVAGLYLPKKKRPKQTALDAYAKKRKGMSLPVIELELSEKEKKVLELIRSTEDGKVKINVEEGKPVQVDVIHENIPLSD